MLFLVLTASGSFLFSSRRSEERVTGEVLLFGTEERLLAIFHNTENLGNIGLLYIKIRIRLALPLHGSSNVDEKEADYVEG